VDLSLDVFVVELVDVCANAGTIPTAVPTNKVASNLMIFSNCAVVPKIKFSLRAKVVQT
jgi:hypothetical protein